MKSTNSSKSTPNRAQPMYQADWKVLAFVFAVLVVFDHFVFDTSWAQAGLKSAIFMSIFWLGSWAIGTFKSRQVK